MSDGPDKPWLHRLAGKLRRRPHESVRDRMEELIERPTDTTPADAPELDLQERALLTNVLKLRGITAVDVMIPRADIVALPDSLTFDKAMTLIQAERHSRYPVYRGHLDDIVGMVHIKDIIGGIGREAPFSMTSILRKPLLVVPSVPVLELLLKMREARVHMALVVDEYGGIDGLVTIEDLVETIVGDISDEHDEVNGPRMVDRPDGSMDLDARTPIEEFETRMGAVLTEEERGADIDTVGGLIFTLAGRVPAKGELISHSSGLEFRIMDSDPRRIRRLRVRRRTADGKAAAE